MSCNRPPTEQAAAREREKVEDEATATAAEEAAKEARATVVFLAYPAREIAMVQWAAGRLRNTCAVSLQAVRASDDARALAAAAAEASSPEDAEKIAHALDTVMPVHFAENMESAVHMAATCAESDDTVLLAPACASLDQYDNYMARGDAFCAAVEALKR